MRFYSLVHRMLAPIDKGIQTAHVVAVMAKQCEAWYQTPASHAYQCWVDHHETIIVLNGGGTKDLLEVNEEIRYLADQLDLPHAWFHEDEQSLNGSITAVGVVVPESVYEARGADFTNTVQPAVEAGIIELTPLHVARLKLHDILRYRQLA